MPPASEVRELLRQDDGAQAGAHPKRRSDADAYGRALSPDGKTWASPPCLTLLPERLDEPARVKKPADLRVLLRATWGMISRPASGARR